MTPIKLSWSAFASGAALAAALAGCAAHNGASRSARPGEGIAAYRGIVNQAQGAMQTALRALDRVGAETNRCPARTLASFSTEVERLEVDSLRLRARAQTMEARGAAYFENWHESLARVEDPRIRELATQHRAELRQRFASLQRNSDRTRASFKPFLDGLRELRRELENDPGAVARETTRDLIRATQARGQQVQQGIAGVGEELKAMAALLTPGKAVTSR
jgi:hypothetical protein